MGKHRSYAPILAAVLLLLPVLYVGSYLALVDPPDTIDTLINREFDGRNRNYRTSAEWIDAIFWPLERIDRRVRPAAWRLRDYKTPEAYPSCQ